MLEERTINFIKRGDNKFKNKYDYSKFKYINNTVRGVVICEEHGEFEVTPATHTSISKYGGCKICRKVINGRLKHYDNCVNSARSCDSKTEFMTNFRNLYSIAHTYGWIDEICSHMMVRGNKYNRCIYSYEFVEYNTVYVGLTYDINVRNGQHNNNGPVFNNIEIPTPIQKTNYLNVDIIGELEREMLDEYIKNGWTVLNGVKAGGLGGNKHSINYTKEQCFEIAKRYSKISDCEKKNYKVCQILRKNGWVKDAFNHIFIKYKFICFNKNGFFVKIFNNLNDVKLELNVNPTGVSNCLNKKSKYSGNFKFIRYIEWVGQGSPMKVDPINNQQVNSKKIKQLTLNGEFLNEFNSIADCVRFLNKKDNCRSSITKCCVGKLKSAYGFIWVYK